MSETVDVNDLLAAKAEQLNEANHRAAVAIARSVALQREVAALTEENERLKKNPSDEITKE